MKTSFKIIIGKNNRGELYITLFDGVGLTTLKTHDIVAPSEYLKPQLIN